MWRMRSGRASKSLVAFEGEFVAGDRAGFGQSAGGKFQDGMGQQAEGDPATDHVGADFQDFLFLIQEYDVDGKFHAEGMNALGGCDPEAFAGIEFGVLQQAGAAFGAGVGDIGAIGQYASPGIGNP
jgi:hypothetical protein